MKIVLSNVIDESNVLDFSRGTPVDTDLVENEKLLRVLEASDNILNFIISKFKWNGYRTTIDSEFVIGYNIKDITVSGDGLTESDAYSKWLEDFKSKESKFKRLIAITELSQTQYDSLLALYYLTGKFTSIGTSARMFDLTEWIKEKKWDYIATALSESGYDRPTTQALATIMMFGDYGRYTPRTILKEQGLNQLRKDYPLMTDKVARQQAEYVYYAETKRFLPNLTQTRKRQIVDKLKQ